MAQEGLTMRDIRELIRLRFDLKLSQRKTAKASGFGKTTVLEYERLAKAAGITSVADLSGLSLPEINRKLGIAASQNLTTPPDRLIPFDKVIPNWSLVREELSRSKHMTLMLLWTEYKTEHLEKSYQYSQFCELFNQWRRKISVVMRQEHKAGEKTFVDYAGTTMSVMDSESGELRTAQIFVGALGASSYVYADATWTQGIPDWLMSHRRMFEFFGGVSEILVPDNLKSGITKPNRYEAKTNESYREFSEHYGTCVIPARVKKPKDKAKVEVSVQVVTRWITMALRKRIFYCLEELNDAIRILLVKLNDRKMRHLGKSRKELFELLDKPVLKPLPANPYEYGEWKNATVNVDYHIAYDQSYYSVPYQLTGKTLFIRASYNTVEIYQDLQRICSHRRTYLTGKYVTDPAHRPRSHAEHAKWTPERITEWAGSKGKAVGMFVARLIESKVHPEQAYRSALGCIRLADKYSAERLNRACQKSLDIGSYKYHTVSNILKNGMDKLEEKPEIQSSLKEQFRSPENIRGSGYYH